ncbi:NAD(P)/FAD-dependent oxidoreductase [Thermodesulfobacteriota bacterium]
MLREQYDVAIIGSGPAGAAAARALSGQGIETVIIEKAAIPRHKMCGGLLFASAVKILRQNFGEIPDRAYGDPRYVKGTLTYPSGNGLPQELRFRKQDYEGAGNFVHRGKFDEWLCSCSDAELIDQCRLAGFSQKNHKILLRLKKDKGSSLVAVRYLVGADGAVSRVRKILFPDMNKTITYIPQVEEWYRGEIDLDPEWFHAFYDRSLTGFMASVVLKNNIIIPTSGGLGPYSPKEFYRNFISYLNEKHNLRIKERIGGYGCVVHDMPASGNFQMGKDNVLLVGEAGGFNRCAEGITSALLTGKAAGESILKSMDTGDGPLGFYEELAEPEIAMCGRSIRFMEKTLEVNPYRRG